MGGWPLGPAKAAFRTREGTFHTREDAFRRAQVAHRGVPRQSSLHSLTHSDGAHHATEPDHCRAYDSRYSDHRDWPHRPVGSQGPCAAPPPAPRVWLRLGDAHARHRDLRHLHQSCSGAKLERLWRHSPADSSHSIWPVWRLLVSVQGQHQRPPQIDAEPVHRCLSGGGCLHAAARALFG